MFQLEPDLFKVKDKITIRKMSAAAKKLWLFCGGMQWRITVQLYCTRHDLLAKFIILFCVETLFKQPWTIPFVN